ncbi:MAG: class I SAM-dependent methyltransferase [archaeon]
MRHNEYVNEKYNQWISENSGVSIMGYGNKSSQDTRFDALMKIGGMSGKTVLDIGCGRGDFARRATEKGIMFKKYLGTDIVQKMIDIAKEMNSMNNTEFRVLDILDTQELLSFDYVLMSGTLNLNVPDTLNIAKCLIRKAYEIAGIAVGFNMTSTLGDPGCRTSHTYYFDPFEILRFCSTLTRDLCFDHTYLPHDFTIFMYKKANR